MRSNSLAKYSFLSIINNTVNNSIQILCISESMLSNMFNIIIKFFIGIFIMPRGQRRLNTTILYSYI